LKNVPYLKSAGLTAEFSLQGVSPAVEDENKLQAAWLFVQAKVPSNLLEFLECVGK